MIGIMIDEGLLLPLDKDAIPNLRRTWRRTSRRLPYDPNRDYSVAYQYGTTGLGVNLDLVGDAFTPSWALVFDTAVDRELPRRRLAAQRPS